MIAAIILAASQHVSMIVIGRIFQGIAVSPVCFRHTFLCRTACATFAVYIKSNACKSTQIERWSSCCYIVLCLTVVKVQLASDLLLLLQISFASVSVPIYNR